MQEINERKNEWTSISSRILISGPYKVLVQCPAGMTTKITCTFLYLNEMFGFCILPTRLLSILNESNASISITPGKCCIP